MKQIFKAVHIGQKLPDGWVVMGVSPDTGKVFSAEPAGHALSGHRTWHEGETHANALRQAGHDDARQPTEKELQVIYNEVAKAKRNTDAQLETDHESYYWASTPGRKNPQNAVTQILVDGNRFWVNKGGTYAHVRCVRNEAKLKLAK